MAWRRFRNAAQIRVSPEQLQAEIKKFQEDLESLKRNRSGHISRTITHSSTSAGLALVFATYSKEQFWKELNLLAGG